MSDHLDTGELRAYLDGELPEQRQAFAAHHLVTCPDCQAALLVVTRQAELAGSTFEQLNQGPSQTPLTPQAAFLRLQTQHSPQTKEVQTMWQKLTRRSLRPVWASLTVIAVVALLMFIPQVRAAAINFLGFFRVESIQVVRFNPSNLPQNLDQGMVQFDDLMADQFKYEDFAEPIPVNSLEEASQLAGFHVKQPTEFTGEQKITYQPGAKMEFTIDVGLMQLVLEELGSDLVLPKAINGEKVIVEIPQSVTTQMGYCPDLDPDNIEPSTLNNCSALYQGLSPTVTAPPGVDLQEIGKAMLQLLGMSETEAASYAESVDWSTTLVLPIPEEVMHREVMVNGVPATLLIDSRRYIQEKSYTLVWIQDGIVYGLTGRGSVAEAIRLAESLQ